MHYNQMCVRLIIDLKKHKMQACGGRTGCINLDILILQLEGWIKRKNINLKINKNELYQYVLIDLK